MDEERFDQLIRVLGVSITRRGVLGAVVATATGLPLSQAAAKRRRGRAKRRKTGTGRVAAQSQADCAALCKELFPPGNERGQCISDGAHGRGPCACETRCGSESACCEAEGFGCCPGPGGTCTDLTADPNCGACGVTCLGQSARVPGGDVVTVVCCGASGCGISDGQSCDPDADPAQGEPTCCGGPSHCNPATSFPPSSSGHKCCQQGGESCLGHCDSNPDACAVCCSGVCDVANDSCVPV